MKKEERKEEKTINEFYLTEVSIINRHTEYDMCDMKQEVLRVGLRFVSSGNTEGIPNCKIMRHIFKSIGKMK